MRPHEQMPLGLVVPVDATTGFPLPPRAREQIERYRDAERSFRLVLHDLDGTTEGSRPGDRRMAAAFQKFDEAGMWVLACILNHDRG